MATDTAYDSPAYANFILEVLAGGPIRNDRKRGVVRSEFGGIASSRRVDRAWKWLDDQGLAEKHRTRGRNGPGPAEWRITLAGEERLRKLAMTGYEFCYKSGTP